MIGHFILSHTANVSILVAFMASALVAGMLAGCKPSGNAASEVATLARQMKSDDDLIPEIPAIPNPDVLLEIKGDGCFVDGNHVRDESLPDELAKAVSQGKKFIEIRGSNSISMERTLHVIELVGKAGFEMSTITSSDAAAPKGGK